VSRPAIHITEILISTKQAIRAHTLASCFFGLFLWMLSKKIAADRSRSIITSFFALSAGTSRLVGRPAGRRTSPQHPCISLPHLDSISSSLRMGASFSILFGQLVLDCLLISLIWINRLVFNSI
jgi:hypothetical protein